LLEEHISQPGHASDTTAHHLTAADIVISEFMPPARGWLEWATEDATAKVVLVRYCVAYSDAWPDAEDLKPPPELARDLGAALAAVHGPGKQHRKKHKSASDRSTSWELAGA